MSNIFIKSNGFKTSDGLKRHIHQNLFRLFRHESNIERVDVFLSRYLRGKSQTDFTCIVKLAVAGPDIVVSEQHSDVRSLITRTSHILDRQLRKRSRKINSSVKAPRLEDLTQTV